MSPYVLLHIPEEAYIQDVAHRIDGLILTGGASSVYPRLYGEPPVRNEEDYDHDRDNFEIALTHEIMRSGKPILAICRGMQMINVALGGTLVQRIDTEWPHAITHLQPEAFDCPFHDVYLESDCLLRDWLSYESVAVNSIHAQGVDRVAPQLRVVARSKDLLPEAIEGVSGTSQIVGVQWHPELMAHKNDIALRLFERWTAVL